MRSTRKQAGDAAAAVMVGLRRSGET
jgi:hypothetical protein